MKKLYFLFLILMFPFITNGQTKPWIELEGMYWQKAESLSPFVDQSNIYRGTFRTWIGNDLGKSWSMGLVGDFTSYRDRESDLFIQTTITSPDPNDPGQEQIVGYRTNDYKVAIKNEIYSYGLFLRKETKLTDKFSLDFSVFGLYGKGNSGTFEVYPGPSPLFYPCGNCSSFPSIIPISIEESTWRFGIDIGFSYSINSWLALGVRANALEFQKQTISRKQNDQVMDNPDPFYYLNYGDRNSFGSGITEEGVRVSVRLRPF